MTGPSEQERQNSGHRVLIPTGPGQVHSTPEPVSPAPEVEPPGGNDSPDQSTSEETRHAELEEQRNRVTELLTTIDIRVGELEQMQRQSLGELQEVSIELALAVASHVTHEKISSEDFAIEQIVQHVVASLRSDEAVTVRLNPEDLCLLESRLQGQPPPWSACKSVTIVGDGSLPRGDCRADGPDFSVLSRVELQLSEIRQHLLECLEHAQTERRRTQPGTGDLRRFPDRRETA